MAKEIAKIENKEESAKAEASSPTNTSRVVEIDKAGGRLHVTLSSDDRQDRYIQLLLNGEIVDSQEAVGGKVSLQFPNGWPKEDFQYKIK